jgi:sulfoxide reductase catalytic subunit YedY
LDERPTFGLRRSLTNGSTCRDGDFIRLAGGAALAAAGASLAAWEATTRLEAAAPAAQSPLQNVRPHVVSTDERLNSFEDITSYNNFYEFGHDPKDPQRHAGRMKTSPWTVKIDGLCDAPATYHLEDVIRPHQLEERIYRHRCVEAWSMVIPWIGVPLSAVLSRAKPLASATFVEFTTLHRPSEMPGQNEPTLDQNLTLAEATVFRTAAFPKPPGKLAFPRCRVHGVWAHS